MCLSAVLLRRVRLSTVLSNLLPARICRPVPQKSSLLLLRMDCCKIKKSATTVRIRMLWHFILCMVVLALGNRKTQLPCTGKAILRLFAINEIKKLFRLLGQHYSASVFMQRSASSGERLYFSCIF